MHRLHSRESNSLSANGPQLQDLYRLFDVEGPIPPHQVLLADAVPQPYHALLVHPHHMTVTVENHYQGPVAVRVISRRSDKDIYARKIVLEHPKAGIVLFGIVRIWLQYCDDRVRQAILEEETPLGRVLIEHDVLRRIEPTAYLEFDSNLFEWFHPSKKTYGRLGIIHCNHRPAIELLEVLAPIALD